MARYLAESRVCLIFSVGEHYCEWGSVGKKSGERHCFSHAHLFSHENKSIHYWLFIILPSNKLSAIQAASGNSNMLPCVAHHTSGVTDNE